jgi:CRISPR type III-B/RAMP module RAMP protein Cmr1
MKPIIRNCQFVTPCFTGGIDAGSNPELRGATLRGLMRWWFRALGGSSNVEGNVFGSVEKQSASAVAISLEEIPFFKKAFKPLPHSNERNKSFPKDAIPPGTKISISIKLRAGCDYDLLEQALVSWDTLVLLGAVGFRSNRGAGSLWPQSGSSSLEELRNSIVDLKRRAQSFGLWQMGSPLSEALIDVMDDIFPGNEDARKICTDTVVDRTGVLGFASREGRQSSPLKVKVIPLLGKEGPFRILRVGFPHGKYQADEGLKILRQKSKKLGNSGIRIC